MTIISPPPVAPTLQPIADLLAQLALAPSQTHKSLTLWPLLSSEEAAVSDGPGYVLLARALEDGTVQIDEVSEGGSVPNVRVTNRGAQDVLFLFGEEIRGAKQNRIANASFLVAAQSELVIDVSCVERGRWGRRGRGGFGASGEVVSNLMRKKMAHKVAESRAPWWKLRRRPAGGVARRRRAAGLRADGVGDGLVRGLHPFASERPERPARGLPSARASGRIRGDLPAARSSASKSIGRPEVFADRFEGLVRSYAVDAIDAALGQRERERALPRYDSPEAFLAALGSRAGRARALSRRGRRPPHRGRGHRAAAPWSRIRSST